MEPHFKKRSTVASSGGNILKGPIKIVSLHTHAPTVKYAHTVTWKAALSIQSPSSRQIGMGRQSNRIAWSLRGFHCQPLGLPVVRTRHWSWGTQRLEWDQCRESNNKESEWWSELRHADDNLLLTPSGELVLCTGSREHYFHRSTSPWCHINPQEVRGVYMTLRGHLNTYKHKHMKCLKK